MARWCVVVSRRLAVGVQARAGGGRRPGDPNRGDAYRLGCRRSDEPGPRVMAGDLVDQRPLPAPRTVAERDRRAGASRGTPGSWSSTTSPPAPSVAVPLPPQVGDIRTVEPVPVAEQFTPVEWGIDLEEEFRRPGVYTVSMIVDVGPLLPDQVAAPLGQAHLGRNGRRPLHPRHTGCGSSTLVTSSKPPKGAGTIPPRRRTPSTSSACRRRPAWRSGSMASTTNTARR